MGKSKTTNKVAPETQKQHGKSSGNLFQQCLPLGFRRHSIDFTQSTNVVVVFTDCNIKDMEKNRIISPLKTRRNALVPDILLNDEPLIDNYASENETRQERSPSGVTIPRTHSWPRLDNRRCVLSEISNSIKRATGSFGKNARPKSDVITVGVQGLSDYSQDSLDIPIPSRNVKTAPSTPDVESRGICSSSRIQAESTGQIDMASSIVSPVSPTTTTTVRPTSKYYEKTVSMDSSGQKSPHKELSPKMSKSRNEKFHRLFKCVPDDEYLYNTYSCAFFGDILLQGYLYISQNWFCFYSKILGHEKLIEIPIAKVINITREKTAFIIPNAIGIQTAEDKYVFGSLMSRDSTYRLMRRLWEQNDLEVLLTQEKETDDDISESNNNTVDCEYSNSRNDNVRVLPGSNMSNQLLGGEYSCETSESESNLMDEAADSLDGALEDKTELHSNVGMLRASPRTHNHILRHTSLRSQQQAQPPRQSKHLISLVSGSTCMKLVNSFSLTLKKLQRMPRTNLLLLICTSLALFLLLSAVILTYKVVSLQARLDMVTPTSGHPHGHSSPWAQNHIHDNVDVMNRDSYYLNSQYHTATVERFHNVIRANIQVLGQVHESLRNLQKSAPQCDSSSCNEVTDKAP